MDAGRPGSFIGLLPQGAMYHTWRWGLVCSLKVPQACLRSQMAHAARVAEPECPPREYRHARRLAPFATYPHE